jgi:5-methyltetrahydrofolate--homocysteine methyltransferase
VAITTYEPSVEELIPYIDWTPFFHTWELRGGSYPGILDKPKVGERARELKADADAMLERVVSGGWLTTKAVFGLFSAYADGDDIVLAGPKGETRLPMLRQQEAASRGRPQRCLADFVAPKGGGDHVGAFVLTAGLGAAEHVARYKSDHDDYSAIMLQSVADRLAEALAEWLHEKAREAWGYETAGSLDPAELIKERYRGIRPAPGYPACPDHVLKPRIFDLLSAEAATGVVLTESHAMSPAASVSGLYFAHPDVKYFAVGLVGRDQVADYAKRLGSTQGEAERWLAPSLAYEPKA